MGGAGDADGKRVDRAWTQPWLLGRGLSGARRCGGCLIALVRRDSHLQWRGAWRLDGEVQAGLFWFTVLGFMGLGFISSRVLGLNPTGNVCYQAAFSDTCGADARGRGAGGAGGGAVVRVVPRTRWREDIKFNGT